MGQYWKAVNLDKREFVHPHKLGSGLKLWEILANSPGIGAALVILQAAMPEARGGGDLGTTTVNGEQVVGRWAGDRVVLLGDYAEAGDVPGFTPIENGPQNEAELYRWDGLRDISELVCGVIEAELDGKFTGDGWRDFKPNAA